MLDPTHFLLPLLGSKLTFEAAVGVNGRVWFKTPTPKQTIAISRCIQAVDEDHLDVHATTAFLNTLDI